jgi:hypothetical protein
MDPAPGLDEELLAVVHGRLPMARRLAVRAALGDAFSAHSAPHRKVFAGPAYVSPSAGLVAVGRPSQEAEENARFA